MFFKKVGGSFDSSLFVSAIYQHVNDIYVSVFINKFCATRNLFYRCFYPSVNLPFAKDKWASDFNALCFFLKTYLGSARVIGGFRPDYS
jgi:hypothetical protein